MPHQPSDVVQLAANSENELSSSIQTLTPGGRGWISLRDAWRGDRIIHSERDAGMSPGAATGDLAKPIRANAFLRLVGWRAIYCGTSIASGKVRRSSPAFWTTSNKSLVQRDPKVGAAFQV